MKKNSELQGQRLFGHKSRVYTLFSSVKVFEEPLVIEVQHLVSRLNLSPVSLAKDPVRVVAVFTNPEQLDGLAPF
jgi:hypothetical protein